MVKSNYFAGTKIVLQALFAAFLVLGLTGCGGDSGAPTSFTPAAPTPSPPTPVPPPAPSGPVTISGSVTFDFVPPNTATNGLDYNNILPAAARGVTVEAVDAGGGVLDTDTTDSSGRYSVSVPGNTNVRIRARAEIVQTTGAAWNVRVLDNTNGNAPYILAGGLASSGGANSTRNLNAPSGWDGTSYSGVRAAAPFSILDAIFFALEDIVAVDGSVAFPPLQVFWSVNNRPASGNVADGDIGTSSFTRIGGIPTILILGDANNDTDEYDRSVIVHEFGHYFEDQLSRSDSIGGAHSLGDRLDPRVAFSEGWGNALAGIVLDPVYRDSSGPSQAAGFSFNVENNTNANSGWFNEGSVQSIIYDIFDSTSDGADNISLGLGPIYTAFVSNDLVDSSVFTTIFLFSETLRNNSSVSDADLTALMNAQSINGAGARGVGETNDGGIASVLPIYKTVTIGGPAVEICSVDDEGTGNKLGNFAFLTLSVATSQSYTLTMTRTSGAVNRDPDFFVFRDGAAIAAAQSTVVDSEQLVRTLPAGDYVISASDFNNQDAATSGDSCYDFTVL